MSIRQCNDFKNFFENKLTGIVQFSSCSVLLLIVYLATMNSMSTTAIVFMVISSICALSGVASAIYGATRPPCKPT